MKNDKVKIYLNTIKSSGSFDYEYLDCLIKGLEQNMEGNYIAQDVIAIINKRYDENKKNNS